MLNFWQNLPKPIIGLAPMDGVSDAPFRFITAKYGKPDVIITEFISVDGIAHGAHKLYTDFLYHPIERPILAQIFGNDPELFYISAKVVCELGFDGLDINMGCPAKSVSSRGAGAALIRTPDLAKKIIEASKQGVADWVENGTNDLNPKIIKAINLTKERLDSFGVKLPNQRLSIPVSVKTRIGFDSSIIENWIENLLETSPANITVHGRTLKQMYTGKSDWQQLKLGASLVKEYNSTKAEEDKITFIGNGDVVDYNSFKEKVDTDIFDGVLIGKGAFGNPWVFEMNNYLRSGEIYTPREIDFEEKKSLILEHAQAHMDIKGEEAFVQMRKHLAWYIKGVPGASELRRQLMSSSKVEDVKVILDNYSHKK